MNKYVIAIDQGTTSSRVVIFDSKMAVVAIAQKEVASHYPHDGWVEQDANEIFASVRECIFAAIEKADIKMEQIESIGITNQRETTVVFDRSTQQPVYNAIIWQSRQSDQICHQLKEQGYQELFQEKTGLVIDPYFSATKITWILDNVAGAREKALAGDLLFGTVDSWLLYKLTNGAVHATDFTNASRTLIFNIYDLQWDRQLLEILDIPETMLPEVKNSSGYFGTTAGAVMNGLTVEIRSLVGDQQASLFGHGCFQSGMVKNTYGTGCFLLMNTGGKPIRSSNGLLTTIAWSLDNEVTYALEGSVFVAGSAIKWLQRGLELFAKPQSTSAMATAIKDNENVYFVPAFVGLGAPYWNYQSRGMIVGITGATTKNTFVRSALEALAYQTRDVLEVMVQESGIDIKVLKVDGKVTDNDFLMQFQADILQTEVVKAPIAETTALGAALLAGLATGYYPVGKMLDERIPGQIRFQPQLSEVKAARYYQGWKNAVATCVYHSQFYDRDSQND
ncbi:MAG: glycerol kinase GlpK [Erysipelotrichaceae bacterium]|nr:glycerol kinase GlpK [Erysipelotrichaceae bacterium]